MGHQRKPGRPRLAEETERVAIRVPVDTIRKVGEVASGKTRSDALREVIDAGIVALAANNAKRPRCAAGTSES